LKTEGAASQIRALARGLAKAPKVRRSCPCPSPACAVGRSVPSSRPRATAAPGDWGAAKGSRRRSWPAAVDLDTRHGCPASHADAAAPALTPAPDPCTPDYCSHSRFLLAPGPLHTRRTTGVDQGHEGRAVSPFRPRPTNDDRCNRCSRECAIYCSRLSIPECNFHRRCFRQLRRHSGARNAWCRCYPLWLWCHRQTGFSDRC
jgi:hypothetical protein